MGVGKGGRGRCRCFPERYAPSIQQGHGRKTMGCKEVTGNPHDTTRQEDYAGCGPCPTRTPASGPPARMSRTSPAMATFSLRASLRPHVSAWGSHGAHWPQDRAGEGGGVAAQASGGPAGARHLHTGPACPLPGGFCRSGRTRRTSERPLRLP